MTAMAFQITSVTFVYSTVYLGTDHRKHQKLRVSGLCVVNSPVTGEFHAQRVSKAENVSIWWRHHAHTPVHLSTICQHCCEGATDSHKSFRNDNCVKANWIIAQPVWQSFSTVNWGNCSHCGNFHHNYFHNDSYWCQIAGYSILTWSAVLWTI